MAEFDDPDVASSIQATSVATREVWRREMAWTPMAPPQPHLDDATTERNSARERISVRRQRRSLALLGALVALTLVGCDGGSSIASSPGASPETPSFGEGVVTCGEWGALGEPERSSMASVPRFVPGGGGVLGVDVSVAVSSEGNPSAFLSDGTVVSGYEAFFDWACPQFTPGTTLADVRGALFADAGDTGQTCGDFLALPEAAQSAWVEAAQAATLPSSLAIDAARTFCAGSTDTEFLAAYAALAQDERNRLGNEAIRAAEGPADSWSLHWVDEDWGNTFSYTVSFGPVQRAGSAHPDSLSFHAGDSCGVDSENDAAIPVIVTATNASPGYDGLIPAKFWVTRVDTGRSGTGEVLPSTVTIAIEAVTYAGPVCASAGSDGGVGAIFSMQSGSSVAFDESVSFVAFITLKDYYAPSYPNGNSDELAKYWIQSEGAEEISLAGVTRPKD